MNYEDLDQITMRWKQTEDSLSHQEDHSQSYSLKSSHVNPSNTSEETKTNLVTQPVKNKVKSHAPQIMDQDTEQFKLKLEHLLNGFKTDAITEFMQMKKSMLDEQRHNVKSETQKYLVMYEEKTAELNQTKQQLAFKINENLKSSTQIENTTTLIFKLKSKLQNQKRLFQIFHKIKSYSHQQKQKKYQIKQGLKNTSLRLSKQFFNLWTNQFQKDKTKKTITSLEQQHLDETKRLSDKFNKDHELINQRVIDLSIQLEEANKIRLNMQENLKRAFMRGVCALNFEAMNVLQGNPQQSNINEVIKQENQFSQIGQNILESDEVQKFLMNPLNEIGNFQNNSTVQNLNFNTISNNNSTITNNSHLQVKEPKDAILKNKTQDKQIVFFDNLVDTKENKWKEAAIVGIKQQENQVNNYQKKELQQQNFDKLDKLEKLEMYKSKPTGLTQQDENDEFDSHQNEGKVIKVNLEEFEKTKSSKSKMKPAVAPSAMSQKKNIKK